MYGVIDSNVVLMEDLKMEVVNGGSFALLAVVVVAIFVYVEREKLRKVF